jgi:hypothetical protein
MIAPQYLNPKHPEYIGDAEAKRWKEWGKKYNEAWHAHKRERDPVKRRQHERIISVCGVGAPTIEKEE